MWSKAGLIGMAFQEFINDVHLMKTNLEQINSNVLEQVPAEVLKRDFYYLLTEALENKCEWYNRLFPNRDLTDEL